MFKNLWLALLGNKQLNGPKAVFRWKGQSFAADSRDCARIRTKTIEVERDREREQILDYVPWRMLEGKLYQFEPQEFLDFAAAIDKWHKEQDVR